MQQSESQRGKAQVATRKTCAGCAAQNPEGAKFCKECGLQFSSTVQSASQDSAPASVEVIGHPMFHAEIEELRSIAALATDDSKETKMRLPERHYLFLGGTGTGKTHVARALATRLKEFGLLSRGHLKEVNESECAANVASILKAAKGGVLLIEQIHSSLKRDQDPPSYLIEICKFIETRPTDTCIILTGLREEVLDTWNSPKFGNVRARFQAPWLFNDYCGEELAEIARRHYTAEGWLISEDALAKIGKLAAQERRKNPGVFKNAWFVTRDTFSTTLVQVGRRRQQKKDASKEIGAEDIAGEVEKTKTLSEIITSFDSLVGLQNIRDFVCQIAESIQIQKERQEEEGDISTAKQAIHIILTGNPGTGKTTVARILGEAFRAIGLLTYGHIVEVDRSKLVAEYVGQTAPKVHKACDEAIDGILFVDEAYTLASREAGQEDQFGREAIETLMKRMEDDRGKFVVIAVGYKAEMERFLAANDGLKSRFTHYIHINDYTADELTKIFLQLALREKLTLSPACIENLGKITKTIQASKDRTFANGRVVRNLFEDSKRKQGNRIAKLGAEKRKDALSRLESEDLAFDLKTELALDDILGELNKFVGMGVIKEHVKTLAARIQIEMMKAEHGSEMENPAMHIILTGNPGTGKTSLARIMGKVFRATSLLATDKVVEVDRSSLVGQYVGQTSKLVNEQVDRAMGGILFIDEAYTLVPEGVNDIYGREAVETLMKRLEDDKGKFVCIAAGYHYEMNRFLNANPGLKRRFNHTWHIEDYSAGELEVIFRAMAKKRGYNLSDDLDKSLLPFVETLVQNKTKNFGNAGDIFNIVQKTISTQATRLTALGRKPTKEELFMLFAADLPLNAGQMQKKVSVDEALAKLNALIGLDCVKDQISNISSLMEVAKIRQSLGGAESSKGFHFVFTGNPGTGKTTVARILGEVLAALGVLSSGHVVEVDRSKLVGTHIGHSEEITQKKVEEAMGGVLFVDEAYSLVGEGNDFGQKVIDTLLKLMEDHRGKFVVIAAGYRQDMDRFLNSNEGLRSRFTNFVDFEDYGPSEMAQIFRFFCDNARLQYDVTAERKTLELMTTLCTNKKPGFANGRTARNIFEKTMLKQAKRIQRIPEFPNLSNSILSSFEPEDIPGPEDL